MPRTLAIVFGLLVGSPCAGQDAVPQPESATIKIGDIVHGEVTKESPVVHTPTIDRGYADAPVRGVRSRLAVPAGPVMIDVRSYFFDAYVVVRDAKGDVLVEDDDGLIGTHARAVCDVKSDEVLLVDVCALHGNLGSYTVSVAAGRPKQPSLIEREKLDLDDAKAAVAVLDRGEGAESSALADALGRLGHLLWLHGDFVAAEPVYVRQLRLLEKAHGAESEEAAMASLNLAAQVSRQGRLSEARALDERAVATFEKVCGPDHPDTAFGLNNLGRVLQAMGDFEAARPVFERALAIREKVLGPEHPDTAGSLNNLAFLFQEEGKYEEARPLFERALAIRQKVLGPQHPDTAASQSNLADLCRYEGRYEEAEILFKRALRIREEARGPDHPDTALTLNDLGLLYLQEGRYEEARPLLERALAIHTRVYGPDHPEVAKRLINFAALFDLQGRFDEARRALERALAVNEKSLGLNHPQTARTLNNIAEILRKQRRFSEALPYYERVLAIWERTLGPQHPDVAICLSNRALDLESMGEFVEAQSSFERALAIDEKVLHELHPATALVLGNFATLLKSRGHHAEARSLFERALAIDEKSLGPSHPQTTWDLDHFALLLLDEGKAVEALECAEQVVTRSRTHALAEASVASDSDAARWFLQALSELALVVGTASPRERSSDAILADVLWCKGAAFRLVRARRRALAEGIDPESRTTLARLNGVRAAISNLFAKRSESKREPRESEMEGLRREREELETKLARVAAARPDLQPTQPSQLRAALLHDTVLLDFVELPVYEPAVVTHDKVERPGRWGDPRLSVWISRGGAATTTWVDLGPSGAIEQAITDYLDVVADSGGAGATVADGATRASKLRQLVWDPLATHMGDARHVIVCPDGALATLPFGLIVDQSGRYLLETHAFAQIEDVTSLARPMHAGTAMPAPAAPAAAQPTSPVAPSLLVVGAIDYEMGAELADGLVATNERRGSFSNAWLPLPETRREADGIVQLHKSRFANGSRLSLLTERDPTEERLKSELPKYDVLHLATHGYFMVNDLVSISDSLRADDDRTSFETDERRLLAGYWPQFLCGVVCAGANHPQPNRDNGLLTGDEVSALDLSHCDLVVLSACETALGKRQAGEGLLSLTRSFREAGAKTVISSLWSVNDNSTKELMLDFYDRLWNKKEGKLDALRDAQLDMLRKNREKYGDTRPATWGAFVLTGETE